MYQNYIFDLYGTLIDIHTNETKASLWEKMVYFYGYHGAHYTTKELKKEYLKLCVIEEEKLGQVDSEIEISEVFLQLFLKKGVMADTNLAVQAGELFRIQSTQYVKLYEGVTELLEELKKKGKSLYVLSNAQRIFTAPELRLLGIEHYFDDIFISSDIGYKKPSSKFYESLITKYQLDKSKSIMIGNDPTADIKGAFEVGLSTLYIHSNLSPVIVETLQSNYTIKLAWLIL
jgi:putative hydrolase of the HAD superfamily